MRGLLKNQIYGALGSATILFAFFMIVGICLLVTGNPNLLYMFILATAPPFSLTAVSSFRKETSSKWSKYELTTPIRRKDVVKSRYISHALWSIFGILLSALFMWLTIAIHGNKFFYYTIRDPLALFCIGIGFAILVGTIFYPATYILGTDKSEIITAISMFVAIGITAGIVWMLNASYGFRELTDAEYYTGLAIYMAVVIISFLLSYCLTTFIYRKKEI